MADLGFEISGTYYRPDKSFTRSSKPRIHTAKFGDGYEQRLVDGINSIEESFSIGFESRARQEIDDIIAFFESKQGATAFDFYIPDANGDIGGKKIKKVKVVCDDFSITYDSMTHHSCAAKLRRVYEP
jgi:phage-related protein